MTEWEDIGKDAEITISFNELMDILKTYDEARIKNGFPCQMDDELYYPSLTWACFSLLWKSKIKKAQIENQKLKKDNKNLFAKNLQLNEVIKNLEKKINEKNTEIELYKEEIKKFNDKSHHGG